MTQTKAPNPDRLRSVRLTVNGDEVAGHIEPRTLLIDFLRQQAGLSGPKIGCEEGACGACTIELDGRTVKSCLVLAIQAEGGQVRTVEGLGTSEDLADVQQAFVQCHALQCGYCTSGMILSANAFLAEKSGAPFADDEVRTALTGNYCRCTGYNNIIRAVNVAAGHASPLAATDAHAADAGERWVGRSVPRREDIRLVTGGGRYVDNHRTPADLHAVIVRSDRAHARITAIRTEKAKARPGVALVMTGRDALPHWRPIAPNLNTMGMKLPGRYALAVDDVVFHGEAVAVVVASDPYIAEDAARDVVVEYEDLPVVVDAVTSAQAGPDDPALLYPDWGGNIQMEYGLAVGPVDEAFDGADLVIEDTISSHRFGAMPMETRMVHAVYDKPSKSLTVRLSTQMPHQARIFFSRVFGIPETRIQVIAGDVGGAFGAKLGVDAEHIPVLASIILGKPVKWFEPRSDWIRSAPAARDIAVQARAAFRRDGIVIAAETDVIADMGCDGGERAAGLGMPVCAGLYAPGPYRLDTYRTRIRCVVTNKASYGAYRGYGKDVANMVLERLLDQAARKLGIDPVEIRRRNLVDSYPHQICTGPIIENGSLREALDLLVARMDLPDLRRRQQEAREQDRYLGIGIVSYIEPAGATFPGSAYQNYESATVRVSADGSVTVMTGIQNIGQGIETAYAQVAADTLGCDLADVSVFWGDTTTIPFGSGTFGSRGAMYAIGAIIAAAEKVKDRLLHGAAVLLGCAREDLTVRNGIVSNTRGNTSCRIAEVAYAAYMEPGAEIVLANADAPVLEATGTYRHPQVNWQPDDLGRAQFYPAHPGGAEGALVEVDPDTGRVDVLKVWVVSDHGVVLNPLILDGQTKGGVVQQVGGTIYEGLPYDENGVPLARTMKEYGMPTIWAAPEIDIAHLSTPSPSTAIGAKGGGEDGCIATTSALLNAVEDALSPFGVRVSESPLSPARIHELVRRARAGTEAGAEGA